MCLPDACAVLRGKDPLSGGAGSPEMHAGIPREAEVLPGSLRNNGAAPSHSARVHEGKLPRAGGEVTRLLLLFTVVR